MGSVHLRILLAVCNLVAPVVVCLHSNSLRQYPLYSKTAPPAKLAAHVSDDVFQKSQKYGRDKAKFALVSGLVKQTFDSLALHYGYYAWAWEASGEVISRFGYGEEFEVSMSFGC